MNMDRIMKQAEIDLQLAQSRVEVIRELADLSARLRARGFAPVLDGAEDAQGAVLVLTVNLRDLTALPAPEAAPEDAPAEGTFWAASPYEIAQRPGVCNSDLAPQDEAPDEPEPGPDEAPDPKRPWSDDDIAEAVRLDAEGLNTREIAARTHRSWQAVALRLKEAREDDPPEPQPEPEPEPQPEPQPEPEPERTPAELHVVDGVDVPPDTGADLDLDVLTAREKAIERRIRAIGYPPPFSAESDAQLVQCLARGQSLAAAAGEAKIPRDSAKARWNRLLPEVTVEDQRALLSVTKLRAQRAKRAA